jgi:putative transcriptional regulator
MTIIHHPSDMTLAAYAAGAIDEARGLVVATHLSLCAPCRKAVRAFELVGGTLLDNAEPTDLSVSAADRVMAKLDRPEASSPDLRQPRRINGGGLPAPLEHYHLGPWRSIWRGVQWRTVDVASDDAVRVFMLKAAPGTRLPRHRHTGSEWTCVFEGAFRHDLGRYGPGDFDEADETVEHNPVVATGVPCICLVALQGGIELQSLMGRIVQPFIRF